MPPMNFRLAWSIVFVLMIGVIVFYPPIYLYVIPALMLSAIYILLNIQICNTSFGSSFRNLKFGWTRRASNVCLAFRPVIK